VRYLIISLILLLLLVVLHSGDNVGTVPAPPAPARVATVPRAQRIPGLPGHPDRSIRGESGGARVGAGESEIEAVVFGRVVDHRGDAIPGFEILRPTRVMT